MKEGEGGIPESAWNISWLVDKLAFLGLCLTSVVVMLGLFQWQSGWNIDTNLRALLPTDSDSGLLHRAEERLQQKVGNKIILLLAATDKSNLSDAADYLSDVLNKQTTMQLNDSFADSLGNKKGLSEWFEELKINRFSLLTGKQRSLLLTDKTDVLVAEAWRNIFSLQSVGNVGLVQDDPLGLFSRYITEHFPADDNIALEGKHVFINANATPGQFYILLQIDVTANVFSLTEQESIVAEIKQAEDYLINHYPGVSVHKSGLIFHAAGAAEIAKKEIALISAGSLIGVIGLFLLTFRSLLPLILSLSSVLFGGVLAFILCHALFSSVHIITLVIGVTLIGVSIDYSLHYFSKCVDCDSQTVRFRPIGTIFSAVSLSLTTSVLGYSSLFLAPLPGLQQVATFSVLGLVFSWLFVVSVYPRISFSGLSKTPTKMLHLALVPKRFWSRLGKGNRQIVLIVALVGLSMSILLVGNVQLSDDVRVFHKPDPELMRDDALVRDLLNSQAANQFFIIKGRSAQAVLEREEKFRVVLDKLVAGGVVDGYQSVSQFISSRQRQSDNYRLLEDKLYFPGGPVEHFMSELGFDQQAISLHLTLFSKSEKHILAQQDELSLASPVDLLWLGRVGTEYASLVALSGVRDLDSLSAAAEPFENVLFVDKVQQLTHVIGVQQHFAALLLFVAYVVIMVMVSFWYRSLRAIQLVVVPVLSTLIVISILTLLGQAISLFHLFACFLVLGLGMDYTIFIRESLPEESSSYVAILLSAATSCLSFGLLSISSTPMVSHFGFVVLLGCLLNFILAPMVRPAAQQLVGNR